jgi:hypothetical protein
MANRLRKNAARLCYALLILLVLNVLGVLSIFYTPRTNNDPFKRAARVVAISDDRLALADGRVFKAIGSISERTKELMRDSEFRVDVEIDEYNGVTLYGRDEIFVCGLGSPMIVLPLIPVSTIPKYKRTLLEIGEFEGRPRISAGNTCS